MRFFLKFIGSGLILVAGVFAYAQLQTNNDHAASQSSTIQPEKGKVLSAKTSTEESQPTLDVKLIINKQPVYQYWQQKITVETAPGAEVRLSVTYPNGSINNGGTQIGVADKDGRFSTQWNVRGQNILGIAKVEAITVLEEAVGKANAEFEIVKYQSNPKPAEQKPQS